MKYPILLATLMAFAITSSVASAHPGDVHITKASKTVSYLSGGSGSSHLFVPTLQDHAVAILTEVPELAGLTFYSQVENSLYIDAGYVKPDKHRKYLARYS
jgi:hypothetical protein